MTAAYPAAATDRLQLRSDRHAERTQARRTRKVVATPVLINRATREVQHYRSLAEEWESDAELLRRDPDFGPLSSQTQRAEGMAAQARADEAKAQRVLDALLRAQGGEA